MPQTWGRLNLDEPQDDVAVALAGAAQGGEAINDAGFEPSYHPLALRA